MADNQAPSPVTDNSEAAVVPGQDLGSVLTGTKPASETAPAQPTAPPAWTAQLEPDLKADASLTKFKTLSDLGKSYKELEGKLGKALVPPDEKASAEDVKAFYQKIGAPDSPDKYTLDTSKLPKEIVSAELVQSFRTWAHELGLTNKQASELFGKYNAAVVAQYEQGKQMIAATADQTLASLRTEWGVSYKENMAYMDRAFQKFGNADVAKIMAKSGAGNDLNVIKMFAAIGKEMREGPIINAQGANATVKSAAEILYPGAAN